MGREVKLFESEERKDRSEVSAFLRDLADKVDTGTVVLRRGTEELELRLPQSLVLEIQVEDEEKSRGTQHSLEIEIEWYDDEEEGPLELA